MGRAWAAAAGVGLLALGGCASLSRSETMSAMPATMARDGRVTEIVLDKGDIKVTPEFEQIFRQRVQAKLDKCATGATPLRLDASLDRFDKANPVITALVAGANVLRGYARLVDPATGESVGDYMIGQTVVGGRIGVVLMAQAEEQLSDGFGDELCRQAFAPPK